MAAAPALTPDLTGKNAVVTGASDGVGLEIARALAAAGARVLMPVRNREKGGRAIERIRATVPEADLALRDLDLARLDSVSALADELIAEEDPIDLFVMNAGIVLLGDPDRHVTVDGFELHFQTNFLGHYTLTRALLPLLRSSRTRIAVQCSLAAAFYGLGDDLQVSHRYSALRAYGTSKTALALFGIELARRSDAGEWGLGVNLCHPGVVPDTAIAPAMRAKASNGLTHTLSRRLGGTPATAAQTALMAVTTDATPGRFYAPAGAFGISGPPRERRLFRTLADPRDAERVWREAEAMTVARSQA